MIINTPLLAKQDINMRTEDRETEYLLHPRPSWLEPVSTGADFSFVTTIVLCTCANATNQPSADSQIPRVLGQSSSNAPSTKP